MEKTRLGMGLADDAVLSPVQFGRLVGKGVPPAATAVAGRGGPRGHDAQGAEDGRRQARGGRRRGGDGRRRAGHGGGRGEAGLVDVQRGGLRRRRQGRAHAAETNDAGGRQEGQDCRHVEGCVGAALCATGCSVSGDGLSPQQELACGLGGDFLLGASVGLLGESVGLLLSVLGGVGGFGGGTLRSLGSKLA